MSPTPPQVEIVGRTLDPNDHRLRGFLTRIAQPYTWHEAGSAAAERLLQARGCSTGASTTAPDGARRPAAVATRSSWARSVL